MMEGSDDVTIKLTDKGFYDTGYGIDKIIKFENITSGGGDDKLFGSWVVDGFTDGANVINPGAETIW